MVRPGAAETAVAAMRARAMERNFMVEKWKRVGLKEIWFGWKFCWFEGSLDEDLWMMMIVKKKSRYGERRRWFLYLLKRADGIVPGSLPWARLLFWIKGWSASYRHPD
jgi:hypothetical protein